MHHNGQKIGKLIDICFLSLMFYRRPTWTMEIKWKKDEREAEANYMKQKVTHVVLTGQFKTNLVFNDKGLSKEYFLRQCDA